MIGEDRADPALSGAQAGCGRRDDGQKRAGLRRVLLRVHPTAP